VLSVAVAAVEMFVCDFAIGYSRARWDHFVHESHG